MIFLKSGHISEATIHKTVMDWVRLHDILNGLVIHIPNEGRRSERYGRLLRDMGMRAGVSDLFICMAKHGFHGAWIELKSARGRISTEQALFQLDMANQGYFTMVCYSIDEAIKTISWYTGIDQKLISSSTNPFPFCNT
jgi:hypothetical protein